MVGGQVDDEALVVEPKEQLLQMPLLWPTVIYMNVQRLPSASAPDAQMLSIRFQIDPKYGQPWIRQSRFQFGIVDSARFRHQFDGFR